MPTTPIARPRNSEIAPRSLEEPSTAVTATNVPRVALGAVAPTVLLVEACAQAIVGTTLDAAALEALAAAARAAAKPISDKRGTAEFRTHVAGVLAQRVAQTAYARAKGAGK